MLLMIKNIQTGMVIGKCYKKNKFCNPTTQLENGGDFICCGLTKKPKKYRKDIVKLCLKGRYVKCFSIEMSPREALLIVRVLVDTIGVV